MKKVRYVILTLILLVCGKSISQTDTKTSKPKNLVCIDTIIAKKVATDLVEGDFCKTEKKLLENKVELQAKNLLLKENIISEKDHRISNLETMAGSAQSQYDLEKALNDELRVENSKLNKANTFWKVTTFVGVTATFFLAVKPR